MFKSLPFSHRTTSWTATNLASEVDIRPKMPCSQLLKPQDLQERLPSLHYLSCWIGSLLFIRSTTRSSCKSYWERASQEPHSSGLSFTSQIVPFQGILERWGIQIAISSYRGASGLSSWTTSLLCLHGITRFCHSETWLFISLQCWWHSTLPLIPSWWSDDSCSHLSMSDRHFLLDEGPSPSTQPS